MVGQTAVGVAGSPGVAESPGVSGAAAGAGPAGGAEPSYLGGPPLYWRLLAANLFVVLGGAVVGTALTRQFVLSGSFTILTGTLMVAVAMLLSAALTGLILHIAFRPLRELRQAIEQSPAPGYAGYPGAPGAATSVRPARGLASDRFGDPDILAVAQAVRALWDGLDQHVRLLEESNRRLEVQRRELAGQTAQLQRLTGQVIAAQEDERRRVARELHDETMQSMAALLMGLEGLLAALPEGEPRLQQTRLSTTRLRDLAARMLDELRHLALDLRPSVLDDHGLVAAVRWLAETLEERSGLPCRVEVRGHRAGWRLPPPTETALFRITQEALANVAKHARATRVSVRLARTPDAVTVEILDDGIGLPPAARGQEHPGAPGHMGLFNMQERAALLGGTCAIRRRDPSGGTVVRAELPLPAESPAPALLPAGGASGEGETR